MSTVVQSRYTPMQKKGLPGLIVDEAGYQTSTRRCDSNAIGFGVAVSDGLDGTAILGGDALLGITARDVTLNGVTLDPVGNAPPAQADVYDRYRNMAVLTRGHIWVQPANAVAAGDPVYIDYATGDIGNSASGRSATGYIEFAQQPEAGDTVTLGGQAITFKASGAVAANLEVNIAQTLSDTLTRLAAMLNDSANTTIDDATYAATPAGGANRLDISYDTPGSGGNAFGVATDVAGATVSADTLTGGDDGGYAYGEIAFTTNPTDGKKITLNGTDVVFKNSPGASDIQIGGDLATTLASLVADLNNAAAAPGNDAEVAKCTYDIDGTTLTISFDTVGLTGNNYTISTDVAGATASGASLTGGASTPKLLASAYWLTSSLADGLAILSLGVQR